MAVDTFTVIGTFINADTTPAVGTITFFANNDWEINTGVIEDNAPVIVTLNELGSLPNTNLIVNTGGYHVLVKIGPPGNTVEFDIACPDPFEILDLATIDPLTSHFDSQDIGAAAVPVGGTENQVLGKLSDADYDTGWLDVSGAGGDVISVAGRTGAVVLTSTDVGLALVDNTADLSKPISSATQAALNLKANLASPTFTGTVTIPTGASIIAPTGIVKADVGLGNVDNTSDANKPVSTAQQTALDGKQTLDADLTTIAGLTATTDSILQAKSSAWSVRTPAQFKTDLALVKADVGLGSVDNTADTAKPVSTAQQTALDLKAPLASPSFTGAVAMAAGLTLGGALTTVGETSTGGGIESRSGTFGLTFIATEYNHVCATYDARSTRGTGNGNFAHSVSGDALFCLRGGGSTDASFADCGKIQWTATQDFGTSAFGNSCGIYITPNDSTTLTLGLLVDQDKSLNTYGNILQNITATNIASRTDQSATSAQTFATTASMFHRFAQFSGTDTWTVAPGSTVGMFIGYANAGTFQNGPSANLNLGAIISFQAIYNKQIDTQTGKALGIDTDFQSLPIYQVANSGTFTSGTHQSFTSGLTLNAAGSTLTTHTSFLVSNPVLVAGTLTTHIGLDIVALSAAGTSIGIRNAATTVFTPTTGQALSAGTTISPNATMVQVTSSASISLTATPTITAGTNGQVLVIVNNNTTASRNITFTSEASATGTNLSLSASTIVVGPRGSLTLIYSTTLSRWVQIGQNIGGN